MTILMQFSPFLKCVSMFLAPSIYAGKVAGMGRKLENGRTAFESAEELF